MNKRKETSQHRSNVASNVAVSPTTLHDTQETPILASTQNDCTHTKIVNNTKTVSDTKVTDDIDKHQYKGNINQSKSATMRWLFLVLGFVFFSLGVIGALLPVMPTAPFILLSAACWARGSERFYLWLINHKVFGKYVRDWEERRAVPKFAKWMACIMMALSGSMLFFKLPDNHMWVAWTVAVVCFSVGLFLWRLPDA